MKKDAVSETSCNSLTDIRLSEAMNTNRMTTDAHSPHSSYSNNTGSTDSPRSDKRQNLCVKLKCFRRKRLPAWCCNTSNGYVKHPTAGLLMHPSFYTHTPTETNSHLPYEPEIDDPLCVPSAQCHHERDCFEMRVAMAVMAHRRGVSYRDAEVVWGVSRSTIQRRRVKLRGQSEVHLLVTPMRTGKSV